MSAFQETNRLNDLCDNILLSSQLESGGFSMLKEKCNLSSLAGESVQAFRLRFPQRIIETAVEPEVFIEADMLMMKLAINNLVENALKYAPPDKPIRVMLEKGAGFVELTVQDQGPGIADEEKLKVFDRFYRIGHEKTRLTKGTGLGLYLTRKIVEDHRGKIFIRDNHPTGSNFVIRFEPAAA